MAIKQVQAIGPVQKTGSKGRAGGGAMGRKLGTIAGGIAGGVASGGNPMGIAAGASAGGSLGGFAGEAIKPGQANTQQSFQRSLPAPEVIQKSDTTRQLEASLAALKTQPPEAQAQFAKPLGLALIKSLAVDNPNKGQV